MEIQFQKDQESGWLVVLPEGRLDLTTATEFEDRCAAWIAEGYEELLLDFSALEFIASAGIRAILSLAKKLKSRGGAVALCGLKGVIREAILISAIQTIIPIYENLEAARKA